MPLSIRWIAPAALCAAASPACFAVQYLGVEQAQALIFPDAREFVRADTKLTPDQVKAIEAKCGMKVRATQQAVWQARTQGKLLGWFIVDEVPGKHELITYATGLSADGSVRQIEVMDYRENYGYEVRNPAWRQQFNGKRSSDTLKLDVDIKNISGATLSCRHITDGVKRLLAFYEVALR